MNIESMRTRSYRSFKVDDIELLEPTCERLLAIRRFNELRASGCGPAALKEIGVSRRTMFRRQAAPRPPPVVQAERREGRHGPASQAPVHGQGAIQRLLERKGLRLSGSTVGRTLSRAIAAGHVPLASNCEGRIKPRRRHKFSSWAQRWQYGARPKSPASSSRSTTCPSPGTTSSHEYLVAQEAA